MFLALLIWLDRAFYSVAADVQSRLLYRIVLLWLGTSAVVDFVDLYIFVIYF